MASPADSRSGHNDTTPVPYKPGQCLRIQILKDFNTPAIPGDAAVIIGKVHSITMSPVMDVTIITPSGVYGRAVLKLYDRRFGVDLRKVRGDYSPHTSRDEAAFQAFVQSGKMELFLDDLAKAKRESMLPVKAAHFLDDNSRDRIARFEAALWQETKEHFECETETYKRLSELQGKLVPRMYAHIRLVAQPGDTVSATAGDEHQKIAPYLEVKGILLEQISGYGLWDLPISPLAPSDLATWGGIVQTAVDATQAINRHGIVMEDCDPRNVLVDQHSQTPFIIDLAQCAYKDKLLELWEGLGPEEKEDFRDEFDEEWLWDSEAEWWEQLRQSDNPGAIGSVMATRVRQEKGMELKLRYPDYYKIISDIRERARAGSMDT